MADVYRADTIGSLLRPPYLKLAREQFEAGRLAPAAYKLDALAGAGDEPAAVSRVQRLAVRRVAERAGQLAGRAVPGQAAH
jgi:hypothetical protein